MLLANPGTVAPAEPTADQSVIGFGVSDTRGKHRVQAELKRLEQEARLLEVSLSTFYWRQFEFSADGRRDLLFNWCIID